MFSRADTYHLIFKKTSPCQRWRRGDTGGWWNMSCEFPILMPARGSTSSPWACRRVWNTRF